MKQSKLGNQGLVSSQMGLGCMGMSEFYGNTDEAESLRTIHRAIDSGVSLLDTADMYGPFTNEILLSKVLKERRKEVVLATKFGIVRSATDPTVRGFNGSPEYCKKACEDSLKRLGIDTIDLYYLHRLDQNIPIEETIGAMTELVKEGKIRYIGLSEIAPATLRKAFKEHPVTALQTEYSLWSREPEDEIIPTCRELGVGFVPYSPLGRGFLTGEIKSFDDLAVDDFRRMSPRFQGENFEKNLLLVDKIRKLANEKGCTASQLALAWVMAQGNDIFPIPGTKRVKYLEENIAAAEIKLSVEELAEINTIAPKDVAAGTRYPAASMQFLNK